MFFAGAGGWATTAGNRLPSPKTHAAVHEQAAHRDGLPQVQPAVRTKSGYYRWHTVLALLITLVAAAMVGTRMSRGLPDARPAVARHGSALPRAPPFVTA